MRKAASPKAGSGSSTVDNRPTREIAAEGKRPGDKTVEAGFLADLVDHAAGGAAAKEDEEGPFRTSIS